MKRVLTDIQTGKFTSRLDAGEHGRPDLVQGDPRAATPATRSRKSARKLRGMMPWIKAKALVDKAKN